MIADLPPANQNALQVVRVYNGACTNGRLLFRPSEAAIVRYAQLPSIVQRLASYGKKSRIIQETYVKFVSPNSTYAVIRQLNARRQGMPTATCSLISTQIDRQTAVAAMTIGLTEARPQRVWDWGDYQPYWHADSPAQGVRRQVYDDRSGWIVMTTETYRTDTAATPSR